MGKLEDILNAALEAQKLQKAEADAQTITKADLGEILGEFKTSLLGEVNITIQKAIPADPTETRDGVGRQGTIQKASGEITLESDPVAYLVKKAESDEDWSLQEREVVSGLTLKGLLDGLAY